MNPITGFPEFSIPIAFLLGIYGLFVVFYIIWSFFNIYHLMRFGVASLFLTTLVTVYAIGSLVLLGASGLSLLRYDWSTPFSVTAILQGPSPESLFDL